MAVVQYRGAKGGSYRRYQSRVTFGSRRAVSEELYLAMAFGGMMMRFIDYDSLTPGQQGAADAAGITLTTFYNILGLVAAGGVAGAMASTGQWGYALLIGISIPIQIDIMVQNVNTYIENEKMRLYYLRRYNYILGVS